MDLAKLLERVNAKRAEIDARSGKNNLEKFPAGKSRWRILPGWRTGESELFYHDFGQHWMKDKDGSVKAVFVCDNVTFGRQCDVCDMVADAIRGARSKEDLDMLKEMKGKRVTLVNILRMDGESKSDQPKLIGLPPTSVFNAFMANVQTYAADGVNLLSLDQGHDIFVEKSGSGLTTEYSVTVAPKSTKVSPDVLANLINIDAWIEAERSKGLAKGLPVAAEALRTITGAAAPFMTISPSAAGRLAAPSRMIEVDDEIPHLVAPGKPEIAMTPAANTVLSPPPRSLVAASDAPLGDEDIAELLAKLG